MADIDDLRLKDPSAVVAAEPPSPGPRVAAIVTLLLVFVAAGAYWFWFHRAPAPAPAQPNPARVEETTVPIKGVVAEPGDNIPLPPLAEMDPLVRELVGKLSSHPRIAAWLTTDRLVQHFAAILANISEGAAPVAHLSSVKPRGEFAVRQTPSGAVIDPASYRRYDEYADAIAALDPKGTARLYATLKPRLTEAYRELGYPSGDVDAAMQHTIALLLSTPVVDGDVPLRRTSVMYQFANPKLEELKPAQRQFLRMGPRNMRLVQDWLRNFAPHLGIDPASLPPAK